MQILISNFSLINDAKGNAKNALGLLNRGVKNNYSFVSGCTIGVLIFRIEIKIHTFGGPL